MNRTTDQVDAKVDEEECISNETSASITNLEERDIGCSTTTVARESQSKVCTSMLAPACDSGRNAATSLPDKSSAVSSKTEELERHHTDPKTLAPLETPKEDETTRTRDGHYSTNAEEVGGAHDVATFSPYNNPDFEEFLPEPLPLRPSNPLLRAAGVPGAHAIQSVTWNPPTHPNPPQLHPLSNTTPIVDTAMSYENNLLQQQIHNNDGLAEAQPVSEEEVGPITAHAVPVPIVSNDKGRCPFSFFQNALLALFVLLVFGGVMVGVLCGSGLCRPKEETLLPTNNFPKKATIAPTTYYREPLALANIEFEIKNVLGEDYFDVQTSGESFPQETRKKALNWMLYEDPLQLQSSNRQQLLQRFILVQFYFHTTKESLWSECNPPAGQTTSFCYFPKDYSNVDLGYTNVIWGDLWLSSSHECSWAGVTCSDDHQEVTELVLQYNNLNGALPWELSQLTGLVRLRLSHNNLSGSMPTEPKLSYPPGTHGSTDLVNVSSYSSNMTGEIPLALSSLTGLVELSLKNNSLSGTIPTELRYLTSLESLDLAYNFLEGSIQPEWLHSKHITDLFLDNNLITGTLPERASDINLKYLYLAKNVLSGSLPRDIFASTVLREIDLHGNTQITGTLPPVFSFETALTFISVEGTALSGTIPSEMGHASSLNVLEAANTNLGGTIPEGLYGSLTDLLTLDLSGCRFSGTISTSIGLLLNLRVLLIANNIFSGTIPQEIGALTHLMNVALNGNNFTNDSVPQVLCEFRTPGTEVWTVIADCWPDAETGVPEMACSSTCCSSCCDPKTTICYQV